MTHATLLERVSRGQDPVAWQEFCDRYAELIRGFGRRQGLQAADCDEVLQDVLAALTQSMPGFRYDPAKGKFRSYLKTVALHAIHRKSRQKRGEVELEKIAEAAEEADSDSAIEQQWEQQWRQYHLRQALRVIEVEFNEKDRAAFHKYAVANEHAAQVADTLNISIDQVYQSKSRILKRLGEIIRQQVLEEG